MIRKRLKDIEALHLGFDIKSKKGYGNPKYKLNDSKLICEINGNYRLTFQRTYKGSFNELGQHLTDGKWVKNFEDILQPSSENKF